MRIGWAATHDTDLRERMKALKDYTTICSSAPSERLALVALKNSPRLVGRCREIVAANRPLLESFLSRQAERFAWRPPLAGPIAFARFHPGDAARVLRAARPREPA